MSFFEDHGDVGAELERIYKFRKEVQHVEREYLELRILLRDAEAALRADPEDGEKRVRVHHYQTRLEDLELKHPWRAEASLDFLGQCPGNRSLGSPGRMSSQRIQESGDRS
jgi:hypothetical protein